VKYLLDVNVLMALGWTDHPFHDRAERWLVSLRTVKSSAILTTPITEIGFVRVSAQRSLGQASVGQASVVLNGILSSAGVAHLFLPDDERGVVWPGWCQSAAQTTDAHLSALARKHQAELATFDTKIPGAFVIP
jgi:toxin-antitoxin system PIN domain toxin